MNADRPLARDDGAVECEHGERCSGCPLIALPYREQLERKHERVAGALRRYAALRATPILPVAAASPFVGYRTRAKLIVGPEGQVGLFAKGDREHAVVDIPRCRVLSPSLARVAAYLRARARAAASGAAGAPLRPFDPTRPHGGLRAIDLREVVSDGPPAVLVTLVVARAAATAIPTELATLGAAAEEVMAALADVAGVAVSVHAGESPQVLGSETHVFAGVATAPDRIGRSRHLATFGSFVQAHRGQAEHVHTLLADALGLAGPEPAVAALAPRVSKPVKPSVRVLDLYGGSGAIALGLAASGARVHMIESFAPAVDGATEAARAQGLDVVAERADVGGALARLARGRERFDAAVVNPPRRGASPEAREQLGRIGPAQIAYVSCDPDTLARDLDHLARLGYRTESVQPVDMIPLTDHVETVALLRRSEPSLPAILWEGGGALAFDKAPHEPTVPQGEYASSLLARARALPGMARAVPVQRLDAGASGVVLFARQPADVARWTRAAGAEGARRVYIAAARGVTPAAGTIERDLREREGRAGRRERPEAGPRQARAEGGANAKARPPRTRFERVAIVAGHSLLRLSVAAGEEARHQVRRHLAASGHPLLGDERYGHAPTNRHFSEKYGLDRVFLHCAALELIGPDGAPCLIEAPLAPDLQVVLDRSPVSAGVGSSTEQLDHVAHRSSEA